MPQQQKLAWFMLAVCLVVLIVYLGLLPFIGAGRATAAFALLSACAFSGLFYRKRAGRVNFDERDRDIHATAVKVAAGSVYLYFVACSLVMAQVRSAAGSVPIDWLTRMAWFGALVLLGSWSLAALVLYARGVRADSN